MKTKDTMTEPAMIPAPLPSSFLGFSVVKLSQLTISADSKQEGRFVRGEKMPLPKEKTSKAKHKLIISDN